MIVRNEALRLPDTVASIADLADEICIVDTGSTDETVETARALGCTVGHFPWCDDFAAARNAALELCRLPWILSLDADEIVAEEDHAELRALVHAPPQCAYRFVTRNYTNDLGASGFEPVMGECAQDMGYAGWFPSAKVRLFPNADNVRFEGVVHELVNDSLHGGGIPIVDTSVPIHHYPLRNERPGALERKRRLYLALGENKVSCNPDDPRAYGELANQYVELGAYGAAVDAYKKALALSPEESEWLKDMGAVLFLLGHDGAAKKALRLAVSLEPDLEEGWRNLGVVLIRGGEWPEARDVLERAFALNDRHPDNYRYLAIARNHCGDTKGALTLLEALLEKHPEHSEGRVLLENLRD
jgi:glycosyltransferase involved in cell wall biosynthesis